MSAPRTVKATSRPRSVGVIFSAEDLQRALRLRKSPDFFELRLDGLMDVIDDLPEAVARLRRPLIITARSPEEGGANKLSAARRRDLLLRFLPSAAFIDVELSCAKRFGSVLKIAQKTKVGVILSLHNFTTSPTLTNLRVAAKDAHSLGGNIFKVVARTDNSDQLQTLVEFVKMKSARIPISAMGMGRFGRVSRRILARAGSILNYAHLGRATVEGQWSLAQLRRTMKSS